jgi:CP family cyanate transporter-like MFS transporter
VPRRIGPLAGLFLAALALRPQLVGVGPLIPRVQESLSVSHAVAGLLGTIPVLCMGLFAPPAGLVSNRLGSRVAVAASLALIFVFGLVRVSVPTAALVLLFTVPVGIGIGFANVLLPETVKQRYAHRPAFATGVYAMGINLGSTIAAAVAVPIAAAAGGWRVALGTFSAATGLILVAWLVLSRGEARHVRPASGPHAPPLRSATAWRLLFTFALLSVTFYGLNAWLPDAYVEHGWSQSAAGALIAVLNAVSVPVSVFVPALADRSGSRRIYLVLGAFVALAGLLGVVLAPGAGWLWAVVIGAGLGSLFPMVMTLPLDVSHNPAQAAAVTGMMLGGGYLISALSPFVLGAIRDATGSFSASLWLVVGVMCGFLVLVTTLTQERLRRGVMEAPA